MARALWLLQGRSWVGGRGSCPGHGGAGWERCPQKAPLPDEGLFLLSIQQVHGKTASLKSTEKLGRVQRLRGSSMHWPEGLKGEDIKKCGRDGTLLRKYNQQYHKLFKDIPLEEVVLKVCSCALQRDLLLQGRLFISPNWLCFHASLFGKDIKVVISDGQVIPVPFPPQPSSKKSLSAREFLEEPECESLEVLIPEMKWRKVCPASRSLSLPDNIPCIPRASTDSMDDCFPSRKPPGSENADYEEKRLEDEPQSNGEQRLWDHGLLKVFLVLTCFLVMSSSYLAFRISRLEHQLCSLNWGGSVPGHR
ncbi:hypothetical protein EI555_016040 [Monodon monoceros]|uniref:GRAM domain-containing protein n=1 Tax=Monodon monoceros TaxID=40151 RepID=A0A4U1FCK8_MONMO|nr:hypothetical protein EI555_016040 [Monodon monoceros]